MDVGSSRVVGRDWLPLSLDDPESEWIQSVSLPGGRRHTRLLSSTYAVDVIYFSTSFKLYKSHWVCLTQFWKKKPQIILEEAVPGRWIVSPSIFPSPSGDSGFVMAISQTDQAEDQRLVYHKSPWHRFVSVDLRQLEVNRIIGWDEENGTTYF